MNEQIRDAARRAARERKLTQDALAKRSGLSQQAIGRLINNDRRGDPESWRRILGALDLKLVAIPKDVDVDKLFEREA